MKEMLTVMEMKDLLGIGKSKAYELVWQKKVPFIKIGAEYRIPAKLLFEHITKAALNHDELSEHPQIGV